MKPTLRSLGEDALIARLLQHVPVPNDPLAAPGDDCAVVDAGKGKVQLLKTDALVEHVHFLPDAAARKVGWKAAARVVSDFAAMGGVPLHFLVTLAVPNSCPVAWLDQLYRGIGDCLKAFGATLAGGETTRVPENSARVISIAATGSAEKKHVVLRSGGQAGDRLFVTGKLGGSLKGRHLTFTPRIAEAAWLVRHAKPRAMMDLSDGVAKDLPRLAAASACGFQLDLENLPRHRGCSVTQALGDGEDFELLFSLSPRKAAALTAHWPAELAPLSEIGQLVPHGQGMDLTGGWDHFPKS